MKRGFTMGAGVSATATVESATAQARKVARV
jgi:hypothetical protein